MTSPDHVPEELARLMMIWPLRLPAVSMSMSPLSEPSMEMGSKMPLVKCRSASRSPAMMMPRIEAEEPALNDRRAVVSDPARSPEVVRIR